MICGIHDLGLRHWSRLVGSKQFTVGYAECMSEHDYAAACDVQRPDVVIINFRSDLMPWVHSALRLHRAVTFAVPQNFTAATAEAVGAQHLAMGFDNVLFLDPSLTMSQPKLWVTGRAIPLADGLRPRRPNLERPWVGSFGFAFPHKNFEAVAGELNDTVDAGVLALHMPEAYFNGASGKRLYTDGILSRCQAATLKPGIKIVHTSEHLREPDLVRRLTLNDVNCLFYVPGQQDAGVSSALDYLVAAHRPIMVSDCTMFDYARHGVLIWPQTRLADVLKNYDKYARHAVDLYDDLAHRIVPDTEEIMERVL